MGIQAGALVCSAAMGERKKNLVTAVMVGCVTDLRDAMKVAFEDGGNPCDDASNAVIRMFDGETKLLIVIQINRAFKYVVGCFAHPRCSFNPETDSMLPSIERADLILSPQDWTKYIVGMFSPWINVDSENSKLRAISEQAMTDEYTYAAYLSLPAVLLPLTSHNCVNLARIAFDTLTHKQIYGHIWVHVPAAVPQAPPNGLACEFTVDGLGIGKSADEDPWIWWNTFRCVANHHASIGVALEVPADLPDKELWERWQGEPVKCLVVDTLLFLTNTQGYPVLSRAHQNFIFGFFRVIIKGANRHGDKGLQAYRRYIEHLFLHYEKPDPYKFAHYKYVDDCFDVLYDPLHPLADHLSLEIYLAFELDPAKYRLYEDAITAKLGSWKYVDESWLATNEFVVVMVLGAGRGPLVTAALAAAKRAQVERLKIYAVEKNPSAVVTLKYLRGTKWAQDDVEIIEADMRYWEPPHKADVIVSELLGSFADNELSPECLDGALRVMKEDGISIPCAYTSYIAPMQSHKLYNQSRATCSNTKSLEESLDTPYVVRVHNRFQPCEAQPLFTFQHPNWERGSNARYKALKFNLSEDCILHGLVGYFDTVLYNGITLSTLPATHSKGLISWFPIIFPLREPVHCKSGQRVVLHFWRVVEKAQVWYEWCLSEPVPTPIQNANGKHYNMKLF